MGRVELVPPKKGNYITRELPSVGPGTSIIIVNDGDEIRAFYNLCRHRGNKLVWNDYPGEEVSGSCRQFVCKYHAWRYSLKGDLTFIQQEQEFFDVDKADYPLKGVRCEVWEGFIFVNFDDDAVSLEEYLGEFGQGLKGYPFHEMTEHYSYRATVGSNWKLFIDAFVEFYHAPILHMKQAEKEEAEKLAKFGFEALHYDIKGDHSMISSWGRHESAEGSEDGQAHRADPAQWSVRAVGPPPRHQGHPARRAATRDQSRQALDVGGPGLVRVLPELHIAVLGAGWYLTYNYWPTAVDSHIFEADLYFVPPKNLRERLSQELAAVTFKEYAFQDANTLEATQTQIGTRAVLDFPLCDQEILLRHLHHTAHKYVDRYTKSLAAGGMETGGRPPRRARRRKKKDPANV